MRQIKFRGRFLETGEWAYGSLVMAEIPVGGIPERAEIHVRFANAPSVLIVQIDPATIGQFTGLLDKNGTEVYEGDIVRRHIEFWTDPADLGGRRLYKKDYIWRIDWGTWCWVKTCGGHISNSFDPIEAKECEVVGSIYFNPELLKP